MSEPRGGEPKVGINIRLKPESIARIDALARQEHRTRSDMIRLLIVEGMKTFERRGR